MNGNKVSFIVVLFVRSPVAVSMPADFSDPITQNLPPTKRKQIGLRGARVDFDQAFLVYFIVLQLPIIVFGKQPQNFN
jgi:hypothetical protein